MTGTVNNSSNLLANFSIREKIEMTNIRIQAYLKNNRRCVAVGSDE